jgi:hypothetical protein
MDSVCLADAASDRSSRASPREIGRHMNRDDSSGAPGQAPDPGLLRWHIERCDRLRASTASRAGVVLSAAAILSAGNAVILSRLLPLHELGNQAPILALVILAAACAVLVVVSLIEASNVLVTRKASRRIFDRAGSIPVSLMFNGSDTVAHIKDFSEFHHVLRSQSEDDIVLAAEVELWICLQQHRRRYDKLRRSIHSLQYASGVFLVALLGLIFVNALPAFR